MKKLTLLLMLIAIPGVAFALEQSFTQQGFKTTIKLSPEKLETKSKVQLSLKLNKNLVNITDKDVTLEVYERNVEQPVFKRQLDLLEGEYVDSWEFEKAGEYKVVINITDHQKPNEIIHYEVNSTVMAAGGEHGDHGFFTHHVGGGGWGWWKAGFMLVMMVPMMILLL